MNMKVKIMLNVIFLRTRSRLVFCAAFFKMATKIAFLLSTHKKKIAPGGFRFFSVALVNFFKRNEDLNCYA